MTEGGLMARKKKERVLEPELEKMWERFGVVLGEELSTGGVWECVVPSLVNAAKTLEAVSRAAEEVGLIGFHFLMVAQGDVVGDVARKRVYIVVHEHGNGADVYPVLAKEGSDVDAEAVVRAGGQEVEEEESVEVRGRPVVIPLDPDPEVPNPEQHTVEALGGCGILTEKDLKDLGQGVRRVYTLMCDGKWHTDVEIRRAAGINGTEATEGLRRMRELRKCGVYIERELYGNRRWCYRIKPWNEGG